MPVSDFRVTGLVTAVCTPFKENEDVNVEAIGPYIDHIVKFGIPNVFVCGTMGEGNTMTVEERKMVAEIWVKQSKGKFSCVIIQVGAGNLRESQQLARHAESIGADAIGCVGPTYHKPQSVDTYVEYMRQVAAQAPNTPFLLYDIDFYTGIQVPVYDFFVKAVPLIPTLRGLKHTTPNHPSMNMIQYGFKDMQVLLGSDESFLEGLVIGAPTTILNSFHGNTLNRLKAAFDSGDLKTARKEQANAIEVGKIRRRFNMTGPEGTKCILRSLGLQMGQCRLPIARVSQAQDEAVQKALQEIGFYNWATKP